MKNKKLSLVLIHIFLLTGLLVAQNLPVVIQAEASVLGSDFKTVTENGVTYVTPSTDVANSTCPGNDSKVISFSVPIVETGKYEVYARVRVGSGGYGDDSFYLGKSFGALSSSTATDWYIVNGIVPVGHTTGTEVITGAGTAGMSVWKWINISGFLNSQSPVGYTVDNADAPKIFCIGSRENGLDIDKIAFAHAGYEYTVNNLDLVQPGQPVGGFPDEAYLRVKTFLNPVLPGDHPDQTLLRVGNDFYTTGSSFHFTPYVPIYHSTDLVHWEIISRVVAADWNGGINDSPSAGVWQGALAQFGGYFWVYYSINSNQYFSKATSMAGPWSPPVKVTASTVTGYDNSIFVDDNGTPYMLMKNGQYVNRFQQIDINTGQLTGSLINCDFINANRQYSWAEGPVMCKRDGWYYYFIAGNVGGGQYVLRTSAITAVQSSWTTMGNFFATITDASASFRSPNHITQPVKLDDDSWWVLSHCYEAVGADDWSGKGRQGLLHQVTWDESGKPTGKAPTSTPQLMPDLTNTGVIPWNLPRSDYFEKTTLALSWYFLNRTAATKYSLSEKNGWIVLNPGNGTTHLLQKEGGYYYSQVTKLDFTALATGQEAGLYLTNGNESVTASVYSGYNGGKKIGFRFNGTTVEVENTIGSVLWLKVERQAHQLSGFYSADGIAWTQIGTAVSSVVLDKAQPNYNSWVGTSNGLYANKQKAAFDMFIYRDAFTQMPVIGQNNYFGLEKKGTDGNSYTNTTAKGGWLMLGGVDLGQANRAALGIEIEAASTVGGTLEIWIDDLECTGTKIATLNISNTGSEAIWQKFSTGIVQSTGQHDVFLRWSGAPNAFLVRNVRFLLDGISGINSPKNDDSDFCKVYPNPFQNTFYIDSKIGSGQFYIYSLTGKIIDSGIISDKKQELGNNLIEGSYLVRITSENEDKVVKINKIR